jgi:hypothetical protein
VQHALTFVQQLLDLEAEALRAYRLLEPEPFNALFEQLSALSPDPSIRFGLSPRFGPLDAFELEMFADDPAGVRPRHLLKISEYTTADGPVYAVYTSAQNPPEQLCRPSDLFWVRLEPTPQVVAHARRNDDDPTRPPWLQRTGTPPVDPDTARPTTVQRVQQPTDGDAWSMEQYEADR